MKTVFLQICLGLAIAPSGCATTRSTDAVSQPKCAIANHSPKDSGIVESGRRNTVRTVAFVEGDSVTERATEVMLGTDSNVVTALEPISVLAGDVKKSEAVYDGGFELEPAYTLADIEQIALGTSPSLMAARATTGISAGLHRQVGNRPNPTVGYFGQQLADRRTDQHGVFVEQEFVRGNKLALNRNVLSHTHRAQQLEVETQRYRVLTDVRVRFYEALAAQQQCDATRQFAEVAERGVKVAKERQEAEEGSLVETLQSQTLLSEVTLAEEQAEAAFRGAWRDLAAMAGLPESTLAPLSDELTVPLRTPAWEIMYGEIVSQSPELATARAIVCEKLALLRRQRVQAVPNVTGQLGMGHDRATDHGMINVQVSMPLPTYNKNCGNISAAYHEYVRATQEVKRIEQAIRSRLARTKQEFDSALASVRKYETEIIPQVQKSLDLSEEAYRAGELEFLQVMTVRRSYYESSIRLIEAKGHLAQASAKIDGLLLSGGLDAPQNYTAGDDLRGVTFGGQ